MGSSREFEDENQHSAKPRPAHASEFRTNVVVTASAYQLEASASPPPSKLHPLAHTTPQSSLIHRKDEAHHWSNAGMVMVRPLSPIPRPICSLYSKHKLQASYIQEEIDS